MNHDIRQPGPSALVKSLTTPMTFLRGQRLLLKPTPEFHLLPISDGGGDKWLPGKFHNGVEARQGAGDHHQVDGEEDDDVMWCDDGGDDNHDSASPPSKGPNVTLN